MTKELQSSRYIVISFLVREMWNRITRTLQQVKKGETNYPQCTPEKEEAIMDALRHFKMI